MKKCLFLIGSLILFSCSFGSLEVKEASKTSSSTERVAITSDCIEILSRDFNDEYTLATEKIKVISPQNKDLYMIKTNPYGEVTDWTRAGFILEHSEKERSRSASYQNNRKNLYMADDFKNNETCIDRLNREAQYMLTKDFSRASDKSRKVQKKKVSVGNQKNMYLLCKDDQHEQRNATCKYIGKNCVIWFIDNANVSLNFTDDDYKTLADKFDSISDLEEEYFGSHIYTKSAFSNIINPYDKIDIVLADIEEDSSEKKNAFVHGYFYSGDLIKNVPESNKTQAIYVDSYFYKKNPKNIYSAIVHEYCHLLNYVQKTITNEYSLSTWYTEMLAMLAEDMFQNILDIDDNSSPKSRLTDFILYHSAGFGTWNSSLVDYANTYFFGAYLARNFGGPEFISEIAKNPYPDEYSISYALKNFYPNDDIDFYDALDKEPYILFENSGYSLNRTVCSKKNDGICFTAFDVFKQIKASSISMKKWMWCFPPMFINSFNEGNRTLSIKDIMNLSGDIEEQFGLGIYGFSVRNIGRNIESFTLISYPEYAIEYHFTY